MAVLNFLACFVFLFALHSLSSSALPSLTPAFYQNTCPSAQTIVNNVVHQAYKNDSGIAPALIRLHFHDCFVRGCDGSILLDSTPSQKAEKESSMNKGVSGFDIIDTAKTLIEAKCPGIVSCSDILALAARDSVFIAGGLHYSVPLGRRDGHISLITDPAKNLPGEFFDVPQLKQDFAKKGLSLSEMVTLSGAHSIGDSHCSSFTKRLYSFNATNTQDPTLEAAYAGYLKGKCPNNEGGVDPLVSLDPTTPVKLDEVYYKNLMGKKGVLYSDQVLWERPGTNGMVKRNGENPGMWGAAFAKAMVKMGSIEVKSGNRGEIRKNCRLVN